MAATVAKHRSPNYPSMSLPEAITKVGAIYRKEYKHLMPREIVVKHMGYGSVNGASASAISALVKYGLLEYTKGREQLRVTQRAVEIVELKAGNPDRVSAIRLAAFEPPLFAELHEQFEDRLPSEENLRIHLIRRGFNPRAVGEVIRAYRDTMTLVDEEGVSLSTDDEDVDDLESEPPMETLRTPISPPLRSQIVNTPQSYALPLGTQDGIEKRSFKLTESSEADVVLKGAITQEAIDMLIAYLNLSKNAYPKTSTPPERLTAHVNIIEESGRSSYNGETEETE